MSFSAFTFRALLKPACKPLLLLSFVAFFALSPHAAQAGVSALTEQNVIDFIKKTSKIADGHSKEMNAEQARNYLQKHVQEAARFKSTVEFHIGGYPSQETTMSMDKKQFMEAAAESAGKVSDYHAEIEILNVKIAANGKSAVVETKSKEEVIIPIPTEGGETQEMPIEGDSICSQTIMLSKQGVIQMFSAQCTTDISFIGDENDF